LVLANETILTKESLDPLKAPQESELRPPGNNHPRNFSRSPRKAPGKEKTTLSAQSLQVRAFLSLGGSLLATAATPVKQSLQRSLGTIEITPEKNAYPWNFGILATGP
jgi:hypothetical protein